MWLVFGLLSSALFASINIIDAFCVRKYFLKPWMGTVIGSITTLVLLIALIPYFVPFFTKETPSLQIITLSILAGALLQISNTFYFYALSHSESGIVAAYWNMVPAIVPIVSFFLINERLEIFEYLGISILVAASVYLYLIDSNLVSRWKSFWLMLIACIISTAVYLIEDVIFVETQYLLGFFLIHIGLVTTGLIPLLFRNIWHTFRKNIRELLPLYKFLLFFEFINILAIAFLQRSIDLGIPSRVAAVETTIPGFTLLFSIILIIFAPRFADSRVKKKLFRKILLILAMTYSVYILS
ncbi:MAG: EamA family transporter [Kiritimatiellales bacterium]|nr:EamA family transporter [Kiritimatiellales bacterium]